jgi:hypothetical protein
MQVGTNPTKVFPKTHDVPKPDESTDHSSNADQFCGFIALEDNGTTIQKYARRHAVHPQQLDKRSRPLSDVCPRRSGDR